MIIIVVGIIILILGTIKVSETKEFRRPQSIVLGLVACAMGVGSLFTENTPNISMLLYGVLILILIGFVSFAAKPIEGAELVVEKKSTKIVTRIAAAFVILIVVIALYTVLWQFIG